MDFLAEDWEVVVTKVETTDDGLVSKWEIVKMCEPDYYPNNKGILS